MSVEQQGLRLQPIPEVNDLNRFYWDAAARHRLELLRCRRCGHFVHYPRPVCDRCQSTDLHPEEISGKGNLYSFCMVMHPGHPSFLSRLPYAIGIVAIREEPSVRIPTGLVEYEGVDLRCEMPVEVTFRALDGGMTLPYFRPDRAQSGPHR